MFGPAPEDLSAATNSFLEVLLTATDSNGLSATVSRIVMPNKVNLTFDSVPAGLDLMLDDFTITTPATVVSWEQHGLRVEAPDQIAAGGIAWGWQSWSHGGAQAHTIVVPASPASYSATFIQTSLILPATDDATVRPGSRSGTNFGGDSSLLVDASSEKDFLLRFDVAGVGTSTVQSATVRLYAINPSNLGGQFTKTNDTNWNEDTVTWDTAPAGNGGSLGTLGPVASNTWYELDVTPLITGDGPVSIRITSTSSDGADYAATEHPNGFTPELIIELG